MGALEPPERLTLSVSNIPQTAIANDLLTFLESTIGKDSIFAIEIFTDHKNWKSRGFGRVQFTSITYKHKALSLSLNKTLVFKSHNLELSENYDDVVQRPALGHNRVDNGVLRVGFLSQRDLFCCLEKWEGVRGWVLPERKRVEFWVWVDEDCFKVEIRFDDILESVGVFNEEGRGSGILLKLRYAPKIYQKISEPNVASKFANFKYCICKEDFNFLWVRTTDFSARKSIGLSTAFYWEIGETSKVLDIFANFPFYQEDIEGLDMEDWQHFSPPSEIVPVVNCGPNPMLPHEILFQLCSLVNMQKISFDAADTDLYRELSRLNTENAIMILQKMHKLDSTCYDPVSFVKLQSHVAGRNLKKQPLPSRKSLKDNNIMKCYRALITPTKIYCMGPELETSNYVVKHFAAYATDFIRVTFVEEDWSKLPPGAISTSIQQGILARPFRTRIYHRILSILRDGIQIGDKRYEFLAFSASQLRSNSVWMFASNENVKAEDVREWMGSFKKIRSISKCAARMGQLFSSSKQTYVVPPQDVESIPDIEVTSDGISYCFSDGIGKISLSFARLVAQKCGLKHTPSAFQIRYGGYKGVVVVDRNSFKKLSLRGSMLKFESNNWMLNVTKCSESMPCYLNREIVTLLSTLGVKDEMFVSLQREQLQLLGQMLSKREAALDVLENLTWAGSKNILVKMLLQGYEPNQEPFLSMMIQAYHENMLVELRSRCRVFVPKGRILIGCLDETGILNYGQVYVRMTLSKSELQSRDQSFFREIDDTTSVVIGKVVVTKNPCLHPGDVRVLEAVYEVVLEEKGLMDCILFPQKGERPHPNECSGGDLDGDQFFISWDERLMPPETDAPMDYVGRRPRIMDHDVTLEEIQKFFVDYMISDTLGAISTAHLVHADREPEKARSKKCLQLASLHSMAVDFAKTGAPAEMPQYLKPKEFPDFMERTDKPMYVSDGALGKLYRAVIDSRAQQRSKLIWSKEMAEAAYDCDLVTNGFEDFLEQACSHRDAYAEKMNELMLFYEAKDEDEILTGNLRNKPMYLLRDNRRYGDTKDRILISIRNLQYEAKEWFESSCSTQNEPQRLASAWYHVTYHPTYFNESKNCLSFPWIVGDILLSIKSASNGKMEE